MRYKLSAGLIVGALAASLMVGVPAATADNIGNEGCTPGYWKNHTSNWEEYRPASTLGNNWPVLKTSYPQYANATFLKALSYKGGPGTEGAVRLLLHHAVAAYLNAAHEGVAYPYRRFRQPGDLRDAINAALASDDRATMLALKDKLDAANNLGCPLS